MNVNDINKAFAASTADAQRSVEERVYYFSPLSPGFTQEAAALNVVLAVAEQNRDASLLRQVYSRMDEYIQTQKARRIA